MRVLVAANAVPFAAGGGEAHVEGLISNLRRHGHHVDCLRFPFNFRPYGGIERLMQFCEAQDFNAPDGLRVDRLISLQFPAYGVQHDAHVTWIMHQHRMVYELYGSQPQSPELAQLRDSVVDFDNRVLGRIERRYANSKRVAERLKKFNALDAEPLYHPPSDEQRFYCEDAFEYIFCPSRLEGLKRQDLLIEAARLVKSPVKILIGGDGGQYDYYKELIDRYELADRVSLIGWFDEAEKYTLYARSLAVFFAPFDEDYGYVTLEAMLSSKPVITCKDSGGPLEFVVDEESGFVLEPEAEAIAACIDTLYERREMARQMGRAGLQAYRSRQLSWDLVIETLLSNS